MSEERPEFGPRGYLPSQAARRARKIVLREPMGLGWPLAAVGAGLLLAAVGVVFWLRAGPPGPPYVAAGPLDAVPAGAVEVVTTEGGRPVLVSRAGGRFRVFADPGVPVVYCEASRRLESPTGAVWTLDGVQLGDGVSLRTLPSRVYQGRLYVDLAGGPRPASPSASGDADPVCG